MDLVFVIGLAIAFAGGAFVFYRYGWKYAAALVGSVVGAMLILPRLGRKMPDRGIRVGGDGGEAARQARASIEARVEEAERVERSAEEAREAAARIAADVDTAGDAEKLVDHIIGRAGGRS